MNDQIQACSKQILNLAAKLLSQTFSGNDFVGRNFKLFPLHQRSIVLKLWPPQNLMPANIKIMRLPFSLFGSCCLCIVLCMSNPFALHLVLISIFKHGLNNVKESLKSTMAKYLKIRGTCRNKSGKLS